MSRGRAFSCLTPLARVRPCWLGFFQRELYPWPGVAVDLGNQSVDPWVERPDCDVFEGVALSQDNSATGGTGSLPQLECAGTKLTVRFTKIHLVVDDNLPGLLTVVTHRDGDLRGAGAVREVGVIVHFAIVTCGSALAPTSANASGWPCLMRVRRPLVTTHRVWSLSLAANQLAAVATAAAKSSA